MADEADLASEASDLFLKQSLANRATTPKLAPRGNCHYCETVFDKNDKDYAQKLFCDKDCADDYATEQRLRARR